MLKRRRKIRVSKRFKKKIGVFFLGAALLLGFFQLAGLAALNQGELAIPGSLLGSGIYRAALQAALPGFSPGRDPQASSLDVMNRTLLALVHVDPLDPRTFLSTQISGLNHHAGSVPSRGPAEDEEAPPRSYPTLLTSQGQPYQGGDLTRGVFIYHAHTTESFVPSSGKTFTTDLSQTVVFLGQQLKGILERDYGIPVLHDTTIHDISRKEAYREARKTAERRIAETPNIGLVVDLHRDGVARRTSTAEIGGEKVGRILLVVGKAHPNWQSNMDKAQRLHEALERMAPGISRGIKERNLVYNQDLHPGALLVEVGGHENSLEEALRTLPYLARALAEILYQTP